MSTNGHIPTAGFRLLERTSATVPGIEHLAGEIRRALDSLRLASDKLRGKRIAVTAGSRGVARVAELLAAVCGWLKDQGATPFIFPAMGSHGGATAEGQLKILEGYGVTEKALGIEIRASMDVVSLGRTPEGFDVYMDRNASEADGIVVMNRVKPHTDFSGKIESGLLKMMAVGMGKVEGASECHRSSWKHGFETAIRAMSGRAMASGKILAGVAVVENELHQIAGVRAARPEGIVTQEEETLLLARRLVPRIPFPKIHLLIVNEIGKNVSGAGMDTKIIGRGVELKPGEAPDIKMIYARDLTAESDGNAVGVGFADVISETLYRKIDFEKMYLNTRTSLNPHAGRLPMYLASDRDALDVTLGHLGSPAPAEQRLVWIRNTLELARIAVSEPLARHATDLPGWRLAPESLPVRFDARGNLVSLL